MSDEHLGHAPEPTTPGLFAPDVSDVTRSVPAGLLVALIALGAAVLGTLAGGRAQPGDAAWAPSLAQAGVLVGAIAAVFRLVATSCTAVHVADRGTCRRRA